MRDSELEEFTIHQHDLTEYDIVRKGYLQLPKKDCTPAKINLINPEDLLCEEVNLAQISFRHINPYPVLWLNFLTINDIGKTIEVYYTKEILNDEEIRREVEEGS